tara:strand:- start:51 stop:587 length:537 start_codon:yes stop_codon:yes gene_type:complete
MTVNFAGGGEQKYSSNIVSISHFTDATRNISITSNNADIPIEFDFTKTVADTSIVLWGYTPVSFQSSYHGGMFCQINDVSNLSNYTRYYEAAHYVSPHDGAQANGNYQTLYWSGCWNSTDTGIDSAGTKRVRLGWQSRDNSNQRPGQRWNPDKGADRIRERTTQITVMEVYGNINRFT